MVPSADLPDPDAKTAPTPIDCDSMLGGHAIVYMPSRTQRGPPELVRLVDKLEVSQELVVHYKHDLQALQLRYVDTLE